MNLGDQLDMMKACRSVVTKSQKVCILDGV